LVDRSCNALEKCTLVTSAIISRKTTILDKIHKLSATRKLVESLDAKLYEC
jgi:hypothetical protein